MKFEVNRKVLQDALKQAKFMQQKKTSIFGQAHIQTGDGNIALTTSTLDAYARIVIPAIVHSKGFHTFAIDDLTAVCTAGGDTVKFDGGKLSCGVLQLFAASFADYPDPPMETEFQNPVFSIVEFELLSALKEVKNCMATDDLRPIHKGVNFTVEDSIVEMAALDSYKLAISKRKTIDLVDNISLTIPSDMVKFMLKTLDKKSCNRVDFFLDENTIGISYGNYKYSLTAFKMKFDYPNYRKFIPKSSDTVVTININVKEFSSIVKKALTISSDSKSKAKVKLNIEDDQIRFNTRINGDQWQTYAVTSTIKTGEDLEVAFYAQRLIDVLQCLPVKQSEMKFTGKLGPAYFDNPDYDHFVLVMPIRYE